MHRTQPSLVFQVDASHAERAKNRASELCTQVDLVRMGTNRKAVHLVLLNDSHTSGDELQRRIQQDEACTRCVTRYYLVDEVAADTTEVIEALRTSHLGLKSCGSVWRLRAFPKQLEKELPDRFTEAGLTLRPQGFTHMVFVVQVEDRIYWAVRTAAPVIDLRAKPPNAVCRAQHKLEEACLRGGIELQQHMSALDVGAAPGGWSSYLAHHLNHVVAIDPAELRPDAVVAAKIEHLQMMAQQAAALLFERASKFDLLVCDVNVAPCIALDEMIMPLLKLMNPGSAIVFTLKNCTQHKANAGPYASRWSAQVEKVDAKLSEHCDNIKLIHLMGNTCHETTLIASVKL